VPSSQQQARDFIPIWPQTSELEIHQIEQQQNTSQCSESDPYKQRKKKQLLSVNPPRGNLMII